MARVKMTCTCKRCGNEFEHIHFCRNSREADSYEDWARDNIVICPDCLRAERDAKEADELSQYLDTCGEHRLPEITSGTDKQIAYAQSLRCRYVRSQLMDRHVDVPELFRRLAATDVETLPEAAKANVNKLMLVFSCTDAAKLIDALR